jgi:hypothetical protein
VNERRGAERVDVSIPVQFATEDGSVHSGVVENISETGLLLVTPERFPSDVTLRVLVDAAMSARPLEWRAMVGGSPPAGAFGVAFVTAAPNALRFVRELVAARRAAVR